MNKNLLVVGGALALTGIGYYLWKSSQPKAPINTLKCGIDEVEQAIPCLVAPCPTICVKKKRDVSNVVDVQPTLQAFTGLKKNYVSSSFFNQPKQRSQDTSF